MPTSDTIGCFQEHMSTCSIGMSVRKQLVKSSELNVDAGKESKLPLNQNHLSCLFKWKVKLDSGAIPSTFRTLFRC